MIETILIYVGMALIVFTFASTWMYQMAMLNKNLSEFNEANKKIQEIVNEVTKK